MQATPTLRERLLVPLAALLFLFLATSRGGVFVYQFHKASSGAWLDEGARVLDGERMYRDFTDGVAPGIVHLNAAAFALFGRRLAVAASLALLVTALLAAALHALGARLPSWRSRLLAPAVLVVVIAPPFDFGHPRWPALALGVFALQRMAVPAAGAARAAQAGLLLGAAALFAPGVALALAAGVGVALATSGGEGRGRALRVLVAGVALLPALAFAALALPASPRAVAEGWLLEPMLGTLRGAGQLEPLQWGVRTAAFLAVSVGAIAAAAGVLRSRDDGLRTPALAGLCLAATTLSGPFDAYALAVHTVPLLPLLSRALAAAPERGPARLLVAVQGLALVHGLGLVALRQWTLPLVRQRFRAGEVWIGAPNRELAWVEAHTRPGDTVFVFPAGGGAFFLTGTRNASAFPFAVEGRFPRARQEQVLRELAARAPAVGVWMGGQRTPPPPGADGLDHLEEGIRGAYGVAAPLPGGTLLLERGGGSVPTSSARRQSDSGLSGAPLTGTNAPSVSESTRAGR
jgi:hypothetical protein